MFALVPRRIAVVEARYVPWREQVVEALLDDLEQRTPGRLSVADFDPHVRHTLRVLDDDALPATRPGANNVGRVLDAWRKGREEVPRPRPWRSTSSRRDLWPGVLDPTADPTTRLAEGALRRGGSSSFSALLEAEVAGGYGPDDTVVFLGGAGLTPVDLALIGASHVVVFLLRDDALWKADVSAIGWALDRAGDDEVDPREVLVLYKREGGYAGHVGAALREAGIGEARAAALAEAGHPWSDALAGLFDADRRLRSRRTS